MDKLHSCPFCGSKVNLREDTGCDSIYKYFTIQCSNQECFCDFGWSEEKDTIIDAWNSRPIENALRVEIIGKTDLLEQSKKVIEYAEGVIEYGKKVEAENNRFRNTLKAYADHDNWVETNIWFDKFMLSDDGWEFAEIALGITEEK